VLTRPLFVQRLINSKVVTVVTLSSSCFPVLTVRDVFVQYVVVVLVGGEVELFFFFTSICVYCAERIRPEMPSTASTSKKILCNEKRVALVLYPEGVWKAKTPPPAPERV